MSARTTSPRRVAAAPPRSALEPCRLDEVVAHGQALERQGHHDEARECYERALHDGTATRPSDAAQLIRLVARTYLHDLDYDAVADCIDAALAIAEQAGDEAGRGHATNFLAIIAWKQGSIDEARRLYLSARKSARLSGEARLAAMTASNLGVIATVQGEDAEALRYYKSSLTDARRAGLADLAMNAQANLGLLYMQLRRFGPADRAFDEARAIAADLGDLGQQTLIELHIAKLRVSEGRYAEAKSVCDRIEDLPNRASAMHADGELELVSGLIARAEGDGIRAEQHFLEAERIAVQRGDLILQGETARELGGLYHEQGRNRQTLQRLNQAHRLFSQLRARRELADVDRRTAKLEGDFLDVVRKWGESIESKDIYTQGHCVRVANIACALWSRVTQDDATTLFWFRIGALLHDVGKLTVPAEVLNKPGKLTDDEWALVRQHPSVGVDLLADIEFPWDVCPMVESHHERWDGAGYPHGLAGEAIPLTARVLCLADVYDALTSRRSYKERCSHDKALTIMRQDIGRAFDPTLFALFEEVIPAFRYSDEPEDARAV
ncbi:MAG TPA: HD domain-containing phosphohydrolase [Gemmatimonadaceae bacterium]|nr:HD domain-containing phosphohydrolase [Gemmatimonadaceae bacterium]